jgi:[CysO sulfur-carrier protein]-S-L-cysteine hydrolase
MHSLTLTEEHLQKMIAHVDSHAPLEACGLLAGLNSEVKAVLEVTNQAQSAVRYVMDPIEQLKALDWIDSHGLGLIGIFHSHPTGPETVSPTDIEQAAYAVVYIILARVEDGSWHARGFWIADGKYDEVSLLVG